MPQTFAIEENVPLGPLTTLGIGGAARFLARVTGEEELLQAVAFARERGLPVFPLGGGSNLLVADAGFQGLVVQVMFAQPDRREGTVYEVAAGREWDGFVRDVCEAGLCGVECLAGIPGWTGSSPIQNIGAYGQEAAGTIRLVEALDLTTLRFVRLPGIECGFGYRCSIFNTSARERYVVTRVHFAFDPDARPRLDYVDLARHFAGSAGEVGPMDVYHAVRAIRRAKGMLLVPDDPDSRSAGSFFKNPVVEQDRLAVVARAAGLAEPEVPRWGAGEGRVKLSAAWLVERAGFGKGYRLGRAGISSRHSLALINRGGATFAEMVALRDAIVRGVGTKFGVTLEQEPVLLGHPTWPAVGD